MATRLILIRHGQTDWNLKKRYSGFLDVDLNKEGRKQARQLHKRLKAEKIDKVYVSDRKRAIQTAAVIFKSAEVEKVADLREVHFGIFEGLTYKELMKKHPLIYKQWLKDPYSIKIPKGESLKEFKNRIVRAIKKIAALNKNKTAAIVCHGGVISIFINYVLKSRDFWKQIPHSASISVIEYRAQKAKIKLFDDVSHLSK